MGIARIRLHNLCIGHATPRVRVRSASSSSSFSSRSKSSSASSIKYVNKTRFFSTNDSGNDINAINGNKTMVVLDSSIEANGALEWALSHAFQSQDTILLVHVGRPLREGADPTGKFNMKAYQLLLDKQNLCEMKRPGVQVRIVMLEAEEKGAAIVEEAKLQRVSLLVMGQRKRSMLWCLMNKWARKRTRSRVVEYCIQNSPCMTIAVRRKNEKLGGYLITTKRHKRFWLLA